MKKISIAAAAVLWVGTGIFMANWRMAVRHVECLEKSIVPQTCPDPLSVLLQATYYLEGLILGPPALAFMIALAALEIALAALESLVP